MKVAIVGASGATGKQVVTQLLKQNIAVRILVRDSAIVDSAVETNPLVEVVRGSIAEFDNARMESLIENCDAVVSCLGHNLTFKGMFGKPRNLVSDAVKAVYSAAIRKGTPLKFLLMNTSGYFNRGNGEKRTVGESIVNSLLMLLLPPHRDNMNAANYLTREVGTKSEHLSWVAVRPDSLIDKDDVSEYTVHDSHLRSPIFNAGETSRINVGHFMAELLTSDSLWNQWMGKTPIIYNKAQ